jgi:predicted Zn finger-like uncharacterized protein
MANIRLKCPTCESELEVDEAFDGQEVECGSCGRVFVARGPARRASEPAPGAEPSSDRRSEPDGVPEERRPRPPRPRRPAPRRPARRVRRDDDYDDDYDLPADDYDAPAPRRTNPANGYAAASLVLGLVSVALVVLTLPFSCCCAFLPLPFTIPISLASAITGVLGLRSDDDRKPMAVVGIILGLLCVGFAIIELAFGIVPRVFPVNAGR